MGALVVGDGAVEAFVVLLVLGLDGVDLGFVEDEGFEEGELFE